MVVRASIHSVMELAQPLFFNHDFSKDFFLSEKSHLQILILNTYMPTYTVNPQIRNKKLQLYFLYVSQKNPLQYSRLLVIWKLLDSRYFYWKKVGFKESPWSKIKELGHPVHARARTHIRAMRCVALLRAPRATRRNCMFYICSRVQRPRPLK